MVHILKYVALISMVEPTKAFMANSHTSPYLSSYQAGPLTNVNKITPSYLNLHPDQASELEAAASELLKTQEADSNEVTRQETVVVEERIIDDTNNHDSSPLSAASSSSSSQPIQKWWSTSFSSFVRRHGH